MHSLRRAPRRFCATAGLRRAAMWGRLVTCGRLLIGLPGLRAMPENSCTIRAPALVGQPILAAAGFQPARSGRGRPAGPIVGRNVFGNDPLPQILNVPKSLYQSPSGTSGFESTRSRRRLRSAMPITRSCIRSIKCWRTRGGSLPHVSILAIRRQSLTTSSLGRCRGYMRTASNQFPQSGSTSAWPGTVTGANDCCVSMAFNLGASFVRRSFQRARAARVSWHMPVKVSISELAGGVSD